MEPLPFGYKMDDATCKLLVYWISGHDKTLESEKLIYNRFPGYENDLISYWRLTGKGGRLYGAIMSNLRHQYLYGNSDAP